jgi:hypothetical protein
MLIIEERAAAFLAKRKIRVCVYEDGRIALVPPPESWFRSVVRRMLAAISGRTVVDPEAIVA